MKGFSQMEKPKIITMSHGSGGADSRSLIGEVFERAFSNPVLSQMEDAALLNGFSKLAFTTDSFVVQPLIFKGGDIGRLAVCGTVNDLLTRGARPRYLTAAFILEEGLDISVLKLIVDSMAETAREAGVDIVTGDTKVIENKGIGGIIINTAGIGEIPGGIDISSKNIAEQDACILTGTLGDHHACLLSKRMDIESEIASDAAPLVEIVERLTDSGIEIHAMRDVTRGGLGTVLNEMLDTANGTRYSMGKEQDMLDLVIEQDSLPISQATSDFCGLLGLDPIYMGNEGKMAIFVPDSKAEEALHLIRGAKYGENAQVIGHTMPSKGHSARVCMRTSIGGLRTIRPLAGEGLPRIC